MRYGFHGTTLKALERICREGLVPRLVRRKGEKRAVNAPAIFFAHSVDGAKAWGDAVLRFAFPENAEEDPYGDSTYAWPGYTNWYTTMAIAPGGIEVMVDGKFMPLKQACDARRIGRASGRAGGHTRVSASDVYEHFLDFNETDDREAVEWARESIHAYPTWELASVALSSIRIPPKAPGWPDEWTVQRYLQMSSAPPPAILLPAERGDKTYKILDGRHRVEVARRKKERAVRAFIPAPDATASRVGRARGRAGGRAGGQQAWDRGFYMEGACDVFALALASLSGLPLGALTDDKGFLRHVVVVIDRGHYADALGIHAGEVDERLTPRAVKGLFSTCGMGEAQIQKHVAAAKRRILSDPELSSLLSKRRKS